MKRKITEGVLFLCLFVLTASLQAQQYPEASISEEMKTGANAVVRLEQRSFVQKDVNEAVELIVKVVTVLNDRGDDEARFLISQDNFSELKSFSGAIISAEGKVTKKLGKGDLNHSQISEHLSTDNRWTFYSYTSPAYPYTIMYEYEIRYKNGVAWYPPFIPQDFGVSVEKAVYSLSIPESVGIRYQSNSLLGEPQKEVVRKDSVYTWSVSDLKAIESEPLCPPVSTLTPFVMISPKEFCMDKICGDMSSWSSTGQYLSRLIEGKAVLPPDMKQKIQEIVSGADNDKEKAKRLYEYLQKTTRYVSIQLGIGGWMPIAADKVAKSGFGDCKALTNYMKAMLAEVGISSEYATIHTKKKRMEKNFSSMFQADHVILMVPLSNDTLWLECTSQELPFNYVHSNIAGHDVLLASGENSKLYRVRETPEEENRESNTMDIQIERDGSIRSQVRSSYRNQNIEKMLGFVISLPERDKINRLGEKFSISKPEVNGIKTEYIKEEIPEIKVSYHINAEKYASVTGSRLFVPTNPLRSYFQTFSASSRKLDLLLSPNVNRTDTITFSIPEGCKIESGPKPTQIKSDFGQYDFSVKEQDGQVQFIHRLNIPSGKYTPGQYGALKAFLQRIDAGMGGRMVLVVDKK